jgi:hypothetical protein
LRTTAQHVPNPARIASRPSVDRLRRRPHFSCALLFATLSIITLAAPAATNRPAALKNGE